MDNFEGGKIWFELTTDYLSTFDYLELAGNV